MLSSDYRLMKKRIEGIDHLMSQALIASESLNAKDDALLLFKRGELERLKKHIDPMIDRFLELPANDPAMGNVIKFMAISLDQRLQVLEKGIRNFLEDISSSRKGMGSIWDLSTWFSDDMKDPALDRSRGEKLMQHYFNAASEYADFRTQFPSIQDLKNYYGDKWDVITEGLGLGWRLNADRLNESEAQAAMIKLADLGAGKLPTNVSMFPQALGKYAMQETDWESTITFAMPVLETLSDIGETVLNVGKAGASTVSATASAAAFISRYKILLIPALAIGAYIYLFGLKDPRKMVKNVLG